MLNLIIRFLLSGVAVMAIAYFLPGVHVADYQTALLVALVLAIVNIIIRPLLVVLTIPLTIITLGLFLLVINALMILLVDYLIAGFHVSGFLQALIFSVILSLLNTIIGGITDAED